ncbi:MAG: hypothetical protein JOZ29_04325, partial [Deltaproteobacteria bacterium]|nr:hypothetical protein [Deltaproteobacteria bacterium]
NLVIASVIGLIDAIHDAPCVNQPDEDSLPLAMSETPLNVKLVLGNWNATVEELIGLRYGNEIVLPDGTDAWLIAGSVPIRRVHVRINKDRVIVGSKGGPNGTN